MHRCKSLPPLHLPSASHSPRPLRVGASPHAPYWWALCPTLALPWLFARLFYTIQYLSSDISSLMPSNRKKGNKKTYLLGFFSKRKSKGLKKGHIYCYGPLSLGPPCLTEPFGHVTPAVLPSKIPPQYTAIHFLSSSISVISKIHSSIGLVSWIP